MTAGLSAGGRAGRRNNFDLIRLALAVLVVLSHSYPATSGSNSREPFFRLSGGQFTLGGIAVDAFFVISGFLIMASWLRSNGLVDYLRKRVFRIYPGFIAMTLVCLAFAPASGQPVRDLVTPSHLCKVLVATVGLEGYRDRMAFAGNPIPEAFNASAWTIRFEFLCYLLLPLVAAAKVGRRRHAVFGVAAACVAGVAVQTVVGFPVHVGLVGRLVGGPVEWTRFGSCFFIGASAYLVRDGLPLSWPIAGGAAVVIAATVLTHRGVELAITTCGSYLVFWLGFAPWLKAEHFGRFGDFSYGTYLYAFPIQQMTVRLLGPGVSPMVLFAMAGPMSVVAGVTSWFVVERHFLRVTRSTRPAITEPAASVAG